MSLIDLASMVLAPTAVKDGKVYNAIPNDQDFTFSRGTEATRINSAGLIEKARTNFLLQSNTFDTTWTQIRADYTSGQNGYDGTSDAWKVECNTVGYSGGYQNTSSLNEVNCSSLYAKAGNVDYLFISTTQGSTNNSQFFNLSNGTLGSLLGSGIIDANIQSVGNGWYRCSITMEPNASFGYFLFGLSDTDSNTTGAVGEYILIQSAQLEQGLVATDVITTTTTSVTVGITDDLPRVDYSGGGCPSLLLEPSRTQLLPYSEYFGIDWNFQQLSVTSNVITSPEGVINASKLVEDSSNNRHIMYDPLSSSSGTTYTFSIFAKSAERSFLTMRLDSDTPVINTWFNLSDGSIGTSQGGSPTIKDMGNGWYRCSVQYTSTGGIIYSVAGVAITDGNLNYQGNGTSGIYIYGAMLEAGSYSTSYIPSYGTSTSRSADSCSLTNASNLIGQSEGTLFVEVDLTKVPSENRRFLAIGDGTVSNRIGIGQQSGTSLESFVVASGSLQAIFTQSGTTAQVYKIAIAYAANDFVMYIDGSQVGTDTSGSVPSTSNVYVGVSEITPTTTQISDGINQAILFPTRLTNDQLAELTK